MLENYYLERFRTEWIAAPRLKRDYRRILESVDVDAVLRLQERISAESPESTYIKYLNYEKFIPVSLKRAYALGIHAAPPMRILDIGTGSGFFPLVCGHFGHDVRTTDIDDFGLFNEMIDILGVDRTVHGVQTREKLPELGTRFDLVTAFRIVFKRQQNAAGDVWFWGPAEWDFFLDDVAGNVLAEGGRLFLDLNPEPGGRFYSPELLDYFRSKRARINKSRVYFPSMAAFR